MQLVPILCFGEGIFMHNLSTCFRTKCLSTQSHFCERLKITNKRGVPATLGKGYFPSASDSRFQIDRKWVDK